MSRTSSMRGLRRIAAAAQYARVHGLSSVEAVDRLRDRARTESFARLNAPTRRAFLKGVGAATLVGAGLAGSRIARATAPSKSDARIAIIGAGMGGLSCAYSLLGSGVVADVYESRDRVGGRIYSLGGAFPGAIDLPGQVTELGGEFIDTLHGTMRGYANEFGFATEDVNKVTGEVVYFINGVAYTEAQVVDEYQLFVDDMQADLRTLSNGPTADFHTDADVLLDFTNLDEYLITRGASPLLRDLIREAYRNEYGREVSEQSCLNFLMMIHADKRSWFKPWGVYSDERFHVVGGNQQIPEAIASALGSAIRYEHRLVSVTATAAGAYHLTFDVDGGPNVEVDYDYVVFAVPFTVLRTIEMDDAALGIPDWKREVIDTLQYGTNSKLVMAFDGRPWADAGSNGSVFSYGLANMSSTWESNPTSATATSAVLIDYSGGTRGAAISESNAGGAASAFLTDFDQVFPGASAYARYAQNKPVATVKNWSLDPNNLGAYTCNQPGYFTTLADNEGKRVGNLLFAGEHADSFYMFQGWMEGAALSGVAAAGDILADLR
jgi:monoamine oxidase